MATRIGRTGLDKRRIIVDCTHTFHTGAFTGIQRVVRNLTDALLAITQAEGPRVVPVRIMQGGLIPLPIEHGRVAFPRALSARETVSAHPRPGEGTRRVGRALNAVIRSRLLDEWLDAGPNAFGLERLALGLRPATRDAGAIELGRDDVFFGLDSSWVYDIRSVLDEGARAGAVRAMMFQDFLPLSHPEWFTEGTRRYFRGWIEAVMPRLDAVFATTRASCDDLRAIVDARRIAARRLPLCDVVRLGADVAPPATGAAPRLQLAATLAPGRPPAFLTVGTLEPRKNVDFALDLFDVLVARGLEFQWHVVGAPGWSAEHTERRIHTHPEMGRRLHWWPDLSDAELEWCYERAAALVAVSRGEGFGLPLVEARLRGLPVFASDIAVFREVLDGEGRYLPLGSAALAAAALEDFLTGVRPATASGEPSRMARSWEESARELLVKVDAVTSARRS